MDTITTFQEHVFDEPVLEEQRADLVHFLWDFLVAIKDIHNQVTRAGLVDILGKTGAMNTHGDEVKKLDQYAHDVMVAALQKSGWVYAMASEEEEHIIAGSDGENAKYIVVFDPLDGSSNIDANVSVGTIFSIYRRREGDLEKQWMLRGDEQIMAGYVIYGSSTMLVYTVGSGTHGFTFDPAMGEFYLSHPTIQTPRDGTVYSINEANTPHFDAGTVAFVRGLQEQGTHTGRYIGSLVADVHRNLLYGGVYLYPALRHGSTSSSLGAQDSGAMPKPKLRLLYEGFPMAWIVEQAGGVAIDGGQRILDIQVKELHQRVPLIIGSANDVEQYQVLQEGGLAK